MAAVMATVGPMAVRLSAAKPQFSNRLAMKSSRLNSELGFLSSQFSGIKLSPIQLQTNSPSPISAPLRPSLQIVARKVCPFTNKKTNRAKLVSHSKHRTTKLQCVNLQKKRIWWEAGKRWVKLRLSTRAIRIMEKNGLDEMAKEAGIDLRKK